MNAQGNQFKFDNLSVNLNIISSFQFVNGKNTFFWKKKTRAQANFYFSFFIIQSYYFYHRFCFVLWFFVVVLFFFLSFSWQFFLLLFSFFNFFITIFLLKTPRGLFPLWCYIMNKYCTSIASIDAQSHIWAVLMSLDLFSLFNTDILRPTAQAIITIYHLILLPFFILSKTP